jgi:hypothetical protein
MLQKTIMGVLEDVCSWKMGVKEVLEYCLGTDNSFVVHETKDFCLAILKSELIADCSRRC